MNHAKTSFSTEIFAGAMISVVHYLAPLWYNALKKADTIQPAILAVCAHLCVP
jgi:hypothetical protein